MPVVTPPAGGPIRGTQMYFIDIAKASLRAIGAIESGEDPSPEELNDCLEAANMMLDSWSTDGMMIFNIPRTVLTPAALKKAYTLGPGGDFDMARPPEIERMGVIILSNAAQPLELPMDYFVEDKPYADIPVKDITSTIPLTCWDDTGFPLRTLTMWPVPQIAVQYALYAWAAIGSFADIEETLYAFPPGYMECIKYNLAPRLAPEFGVSTPPEVIAMAASSLEKVRDSNIRLNTMRCDPGIIDTKKQIYNWRSDR